MQLRNENGRANPVNLANLGLRILQTLFGATVLGMYAAQYSYQPWQIWDFHTKFSLGTAAGAIALVTAPVLALIPFFLGYVIVMYCLVWDFIVMCVYAGTFAFFNKEFAPYDDPSRAQKYISQTGVSVDRIKLMQGAVTVVLLGMIWWLISLLMAITLLIWSFIRGSGKQY